MCGWGSEIHHTTKVLIFLWLARNKWERGLGLEGEKAYKARILFVSGWIRPDSTSILYPISLNSRAT
jgi:hypothetical protein